MERGFHLQEIEKIRSNIMESENKAVIPQESAFSSPAAFDNAQRMAKLLSASSLVPKDYKDNISNTVIALEMASRIGASPLMVMQNLNIIQGKPGWASSFIIAMINASGKFTTNLEFDLTGTGDAMRCFAYATSASSGKLLKGPEISMEMAKKEGWVGKAGSKWVTMPQLMIHYRAAAFFGRLYVPEIMMGMHTVEELADMPRVKVEIDFEQLKELFELKKDAIAEDQLVNCQRIIDQKETTSYHKLFILLQSL